MKKKIEKILFPTDFSESALNAFRYALWFAHHSHASIELCHFVAPEIILSDLPMISTEMTQDHVLAAKEVMETFKEAGIGQLRAEHQLEDIPPIHTNVTVGAPSNLIPKMAESKNCDMVVMGTKGEHSTLERILGSVTTAAIKKSNCPVLAIPDSISADKISQVAYATNLVQGDPIYIQQAITLLASFEPYYRVVHASNRPKQKKAVALKNISALFEDRVPPLPISFHTTCGDDPLDLLNDFVTHHKIDLMVMYRSRHSLLKQFFLSSMTRQLALHTSIPLLVLK